MTDRLYRSGMAWCFWRWTFVESGHLVRLHIVKTPFGALCLHWLSAADPEPHEHDHPVSFLSVVLRGAYVEVRNGRARAVTRLNLIRARARHRIVWTAPHTLTLCLMGPKPREWGFHTPSGWRSWRDYYRSASR